MTLRPRGESSAPMATPEPALIPGAPRLRAANRTQVCLRPVDMEGLLPEDHRARIVCACVESLDLTPRSTSRSRRSTGRPAARPPTRSSSWRSGCTPRWKRCAVPGPWTGSTPTTSRTNGSAAASP
jgi:hypothetical protein